VQRLPFESDSALLLCSDGLSDQVASQEIREAVERNAGNPEAAVRELIGAANAAGGKDNVTVVLVEGEGFTAPAVGEPRRGDSLMARLGWFVCGLAVAVAGGWFSRSLWVPPPVVEKPQVLAVGPGAYASIAAALAAAHAGDTVEVSRGEYNEQVHLRGGVTLRSRVPLDAVLRAAPLASGPAVIAENIQGARFSGFRILAAKDLPIPTGILLENARVEVDDVDIEGAGIGVEIRGEASPVLQANSIHDCSNEGVLILGASPWISHNDIRRNKGAGLAARDGARPVLLDNVFERNAVDVPPEMAAAVKERNMLLDMPAAAPRKTVPRK